MTSNQLHYNGMDNKSANNWWNWGCRLLPLYLTSKYCNYNGMAK